MKNKWLVLGVVMIIAALALTYVTNLAVRKYQLSPVVSIIAGGGYIALLFWGSRFIARHRRGTN